MVQLHNFFTTLFILLAALLLAACSGELTPAESVANIITVQVTADGQTQTVAAAGAATIRDLLEENGIILGELDEIIPPLFSPLVDNQVITIVRVTESNEVITQVVPFERKLVRNESLGEDAEPVILQNGRSGSQEVAVRVVFRDGQESERIHSQARLLEAPQDEIVMIGVGAAQHNLSFAGIIAYLNDGTGFLLRGNTALPEQIKIDGTLDGRVFSLSPTGSHLLYTQTEGQTGRFQNSLWVISTERDAAPRPLDVENVLWADWDPARADNFQIAFTTARPTDLPPGWEANNDLWLGTLPTRETSPFRPQQLSESYPVTYGWWGGSYAWSPQGRYIATGFANEVSLFDTEARGDDPQRELLQQFVEFDTLSDWVWVPTPSWSPNGRFLAATIHGGDDPLALTFDGWVVDRLEGTAARFQPQTGMWSHMQWSPNKKDVAANSRIAFFKATDPLDSQRSPYTLWLMDSDGSNAHQIYPPVGENSNFPRDANALAWGPNGGDIAFIFNDALTIYNLESATAFPITQDDGRYSHPSWAPYGAGVNAALPATRINDDLPELDAFDPLLLRPGSGE